MVESTDAPRRWVWVPCSRTFYKPAYIVSETATEVTAQSDALETFPTAVVFKKNPAKFDRTEDLAALSHLNEPSVLHSLETRYNDSLIYTYSGLFLIALNPYRATTIYSDEHKRRALLQRPREGAPHIFSVANEAYRSMLANRENQSILITGESGAGKTENTKRVIEFLTFAAGTGENSPTPASPAAHSLTEALRSANPILEAFGNAKTVKNDNSSRFGKFIQIKFTGGRICGAKIEKYLLEKSRVVTPAPGERNFHIFYQLIRGAPDDLRATLSLSNDPTDYACLRDTARVPAGSDDAADFAALERAFATLGIAGLPFYTVVAAVLHLSNLVMGEENDRAALISGDLELVCRLLRVPLSAFLNNLLHPTITAGREQVTHYRSRAEATAVLEGLMKILYDRMFDTLVAALNTRLDSSCDAYIGLLDIAGFEIFERNSFEQLCINHTNEKLQQFFNHHMFVLEQELYQAEAITWDFIDFGLDLEPTIRTIEASNPIGVLAFLDEECVMPCANDKTLLDKLERVPLVTRVPLRPAISIQHYAGRVEYEVRGWLKKNRDVESEGMLRLVESGGVLAADAPGRVSALKKGVFRTVAQAHRDSLRALMATLAATQPHFVRCILPNIRKSPDLFDKGMILEQLRCNGVLEGIRISRLGFPSRIPFADFNARYRVLLHNATPENLKDFKDIKNSETSESPGVSATDMLLPREETQFIITALREARVLNIAEHDYRIGRRMVFFRQGVVADLEDRRDNRILAAAEQIQAILRARVHARRAGLEAERLRAIESLQRNARQTLQLLRWPWWSLLQQIAPLLDVKKNEDERRAAETRRKEIEAVVERQRAEVAEAQASAEALRRTVEQLQGEVETRDGMVSEREQLLGGMRTRLAEALAECERRGEALRTAEEAATSYTVALASAESMAARLQEELRAANDDRAALRDSVAELTAHVSQKDESAGKLVERFEQRLASLEEEHQRREEARAAAVAAEAAAAAEAVAAEHCRAVAALEAAVAEKNKKMHEQEELVAQVQALLQKKHAEIGDVQLANDALHHANEELRVANEALEAVAERARGAQAAEAARLAEVTAEFGRLSAEHARLEAAQAESAEMVAHLRSDLEHQKSLNNTLNTHLDTLRSLATAAEAPAAAEDAASALEKTLLSERLAKARESCKRLREERDALAAENLRLSQSKLDELFHCEAEFAAAKTALRGENRNLQGENQRLRQELQALRADAAAEDGLAAALDAERQRAKEATERVLALEHRSARLESELAAAVGEVERLNARVAAEVARGNAAAGVAALRKEVARLQAGVQAVAGTFLRDFEKVMGRKDRAYGEALARVAELQRRVGELAGYRQRCAEAERLAAERGAEQERLQRAAGEAAAALRVAGRRAAELESHVARLEATYNEREEELVRVREELLAESRRRVEGLGQLCERLRTGNRPLEEEVARLRAELAERAGVEEALRGELRSAEERGERRWAEVAEALRRLGDAGEVVVVEKVVSSYLTERESGEAMVAVGVDSGEAGEAAVSLEEFAAREEELQKARGDVACLALRLEQSERRNEEREAMIESLRDCILAFKKVK